VREWGFIMLLGLLLCSSRTRIDEHRHYAIHPIGLHLRAEEAENGVVWGVSPRGRRSDWRRCSSPKRVRARGGSAFTGFR
jgi:hypothetical protein